MKHHSLQRYDYHVWATRRVFLHLRELPEEIYRQEVQSVFPSVTETILHMYRVENV
ncbi:hypothetical protein LOK74_08940 [Brevibacillus humidisoli]|uniref:DinB family protein n=1 Tax=Brevibacillus humidisoli TaxID=2895522 RepID=UPI001E3BEFE7|nr:DinB family protein [Brevibacillus humidisoli]UFJ42598.1 hypothetical protein LOK74_08940 [Brevibacillus humidisoli]